MNFYHLPDKAKTHEPEITVDLLILARYRDVSSPLPIFEIVFFTLNIPSIIKTCNSFVGLAPVLNEKV